MLKMSNSEDINKMMEYYRTSDMLNLINFFPNLSPIKDMIIVESLDEFIKYEDYINKFDQNRVDTLKGRKYLDKIENKGSVDSFYETLIKIKEKDPKGVLVLFKLDSTPSERYERQAGISVGVELGKYVLIDAVSKGFDGREVSKSICTHESYYIPWFELRKINEENFKNYRTFLISQNDYLKTREERINFLISIGYDKNIIEKEVPYEYKEISNKVWQSVIKDLLKKLEKEEEFLEFCNFSSFAISGHTDGNDFKPWQLFDKSRYTAYTRIKK